MKRNTIVKILSVLLMLGMLFSAAPSMVTAENAAPQSAVTVEQAVLDEMQATGTASYVLEFANDADLSLANTMNWSDRGWYVYNTLVAQRDSSQAQAQAYLQAANVEFKSFWINNSLYVKNSDATVLAGVQTIPGVQSIRAPKVYFIPEPELAPDAELMAIEPNLTQIQAPEAWAAGFTGEGYTIANIDTGARYTHLALVNQYRGNNGDGTFTHDYNWLDPYSSNYQFPKDDNGHGTHTMGTMVGNDGDQNQIGVAPGASWMACRGCSTSSCYDEQLLACAEFMAAPTDLGGGNANPELRPVAVNNSWGDCSQSYDGWYQGVVDAWVAAGMVPVFSNGNNSNCGYPSNPPEGTVGNPARYGNVSGVGSSGQSNGQYASHSNKGPSDVPDNVNPTEGYEYVKPQFIAPGVGIRSSVPGSDTSYASYSGTSMSSPHVTGLVAVIHSAAPCMDSYSVIEKIIQDTANPVPHQDWTDVPNNATGWGEIRVLDAAQMAAGMCGDKTIQGTVTDDSTPPTPLAGAKVVIVPDDPEGYTRSVTTNAEGFYTAQVFAGSYSLTASKQGYEADTKPATVPEDAEDPVVVDFALEALPAKTITGTITDGGVIDGDAHGYPLMATLVFAGPDHQFEVMSDPFTGAYSVTVYDNTDYNVTVTASLPGYKVATRELTGDFELVQDFVLNVENATCVAPGYKGAGVVEGFDEGLPNGWTNHNYGTGGVWMFNDPRNRGNKTGGEGVFAMVDSDYYGYGNAQDTGLRTPVMDFTDATGALLEFKSFYQTISNQTAKVRYSLDGGTTWVELIQLPATTEQKVYSFNMSDQFVGQSNVMVEFRFTASWGWYWQIDDVKVSDGSCNRLDGGAVAGYVYDANLEDTKLFDAKVETAANMKKTVENEFEPASGLYWFFEQTPDYNTPADVEFTVSKSKYETKIETVSVAPGVLTNKDFMLGSGKLTASPLTVERTLFLNDDDETTSLILTNEGTGGANFNLSEHDMGFQPLKLNIPAFTGELPASDEPASIFRDPKLVETAQVPALTLNSNAAKYGITEAPAATGVNLLNDQLWRWPDLTIPGTKEVIGTPPGATSLFAGDFLGGDFGTLYAISYDNGNFYAINTADASAEVIANIPNPASGTSYSGLAGADGFFYGMATACNDKSVLVRIEPTGEMEQIGVLPNAKCMIDIAYVPSEGMLYGVDLITDGLYRIDPNTGVDTLVGATGANANYAQGMDYDEVNGIMYWAAYTGAAELRIIDLETGASTSIGSFGSNTEIDSYAIEASAGGGGGAVPWLDEMPVEGYVPAAETFPIELTFKVRGIIEQPGDYFAQLRFRTDTPYDVEPVDVIMHVIRPFTWGNIKGDVTATEKCDLNPAPMPEATVNFYKDGELFKSTVTDENGHYSYALERGTYDVEVVVEGYVTARVDGVVLGASEDIVIDIALRHDSACLTYEPEAFFQQLYPDQMATQTLTFTNTGAQDAVFEIAELVGDGPVPFGKEAVELVLDDGSAENGVGIGGNSQFIFLNRFTPAAEQYPFTLNRVDVYWDSTGLVQNGDPFEIYVYKNTSGNTNPAVGAEFLYKQAITSTKMDAWESYELTEPVSFEGPGDVLIAIGALKKPGSNYWPAAIDENSSKQRSWAGWYSGDIPNPPVLPPDDTWTLIDEYFPGNWLLRGYGETGGGGGTPGDIPWLMEDPTAGVVFKDGGMTEVTLTFDSTGLVWGDYFGALNITNAPDPKITIPVQLRILPFNMMYLPLILRNFN